MNKECLKAGFKNYKASSMKPADMLYNFKGEAYYEGGWRFEGNY